MFRAQLELARELGKPVVIHSREAIPQTLEVMRDFPEVRAVFHCFTGTAEEAHNIFAQGYYMGFDGPLTYKKNDSLRFIAASRSSRPHPDRDRRSLSLPRAAPIGEGERADVRPLRPRGDRRRAEAHGRAGRRPDHAQRRPPYLGV